MSNVDEFRFLWCNKCGDNFPIREREYKELEMCGNTFYCLNGHALMISRESIINDMRSAERLCYCRGNMIDGLRKTINSLRGTRTRERNRLLRGACPYCNKSPIDMTRHIQDRHTPKGK